MGHEREQTPRNKPRPAFPLMSPPSLRRFIPPGGCVRQVFLSSPRNRANTVRSGFSRFPLRSGGKK